MGNEYENIVNSNNIWQDHISGIMNNFSRWVGKYSMCINNIKFGLVFHRIKIYTSLSHDNTYLLYSLENV